MKTEAYPTAEYLIALAKEAGKIIAENFSLGMKKEWKSDNTPLTVTDTAVDKLVNDKIKNDFPHIQLASEEGTQHFMRQSEYTAICDPLDGTIPFSHGIPISTFCITILQNGKPISAVIHDPFLDRTWHAGHGKGSFYAEKRIFVSEKRDLKSTVVHALFPPFKFPGAYEHLEKNGARLMNCCSAAYFGGLIATGEVAASITIAQQIWETPAMQLIVEEANGKATDIRGNELSYLEGKINGHIVSNGYLHEELLSIMKA